ncbi:protein chromatin remodeling 20 [Podospora australis]|uniref:Protein chromatin remodeling 20 n=1 Tax=Podospora australis TaxID=1536484 RepID=A0AAN7AIN8_9PEZI|nr:protein chromatin remodeling 20 [Podospora australis]
MMAGDDTSDPFEWDEERVIQELCTPNRSWKPPPSKRPLTLDTAALAAKIREFEVHGESLLTFPDKADFPELWKCLGIKKLPHQLFLMEAISQFRKASPEYRAWNRQRLADTQEDDDDTNVPTKSEGSAQTTSEPDFRAAFSSGISAIAHAQQLDGNKSSQNVIGVDLAAPELAIPCQGVLSPALSPVGGREDAGPETPARGQRKPSVLEGPPSKKRRLAPTMISAKPTRLEPARIPTEADIFFAPLVEIPAEQEPVPHYLGAGTLSREDILSRRDILGGLTDAKEDLDLEKEFSYNHLDLPPGRRQQVSAAMKRFLRSSEPMPILSSLTADNDDEDDDDDESVLPLFGQSDDEISIDSETYREIQEEEQERLQAQIEAQKNGHLSKEDVQETVSRAISDLEAEWRVDKQPKLDRKAWKIWQDARRMPNRLAYIDRQKQYRDRLELRISRLIKEFTETQWTTSDRLEQKASMVLELSVSERMHQEWLLKILQSPRPPPKPKALPRPTPARKKVRENLEDGEEVLSSESEGMDDFIEYDDIGLVDEQTDMMDAVEFDKEDEEVVDAEVDVAEHPVEDVLDEDGVASGEAVPSAVPPTPIKIKPERALLPSTPQRLITRPGVETIEIPETPPSLTQLDEIPGFDDVASLQKIAEIGKEYWQSIRDSERLLVAILCGWDDDKKSRIYQAVLEGDCEGAWDRYLGPAAWHDDPESAAPAGSIAHYLGQLFDAYMSASTARLQKPTLKRLTWQRLRGYRCDKFPIFFEHLKKVITRIILKNTPKKSTGFLESQLDVEGAALDSQDPAESQDPADALINISDDDDDDDQDDDEEDLADGIPTPATKKRRKKRTVINQEARNLRITHVEQTKEFDRRRRRLQQELALGMVSTDKSRLIVNETKDDDQPLIFINDMIGSRIKDHQIEGVRFMWNQLVVGDKVVANSSSQQSRGQGCLLAHTMGLGKTMQVITLLVVIAEASTSEDPAIRSQIPEGLRESKTLVLCPSGLVDNWVDEFMMWAPDKLLGPLYKLSASVPVAQRPSMIEKWASDGGVLITGYPMFTKLIADADADPELRELLTQSPNIVVGDEAHRLKNPDSKQHQATQLFRTGSRIAMTGSPLTNNVMDYYAMINWVAPNYLAEIEEFKHRFANPIKEGLYVDSEPAAKRKARRMLHVLKETVDPKVHRKDVQVLFSELPQKKEFILTLPLTELQRKLYSAYIEALRDPSVEKLVLGSARIWSLIAKLSLVLAHPQVFKTVASSQQNTTKTSTKKSKGPDADEESNMDLPAHIVSELLGMVSIRELGDLGHSYKILALLKILEECQKVGDKVLVFSQSLSTLDFLESIFKQRKIPFQRLDGATPIEDRQTLVKQFNHTDTSVYLISTRAGGVGLNIFGANRVVIFDFKYTPADEQQAIGRAYRLGQMKPVYVYWLVVGGTFEDDLHNLSVFKAQLASRVVDKKKPNPYSRRDLKTYFMLPRELEQDDLAPAFGHDAVLDALLKSADVGPQIRKITLNETFEKEEVFELSAEDKLEAQKDIELMRLRSQNPQEYMRELQRMQLAAARAAQQPHVASGESATTLPPSSEISSRRFLVKIMVPPHLRTNRGLVSSPPPPVLTSSSVVPLQNTTQVAHRPSSSSQNMNTLAVPPPDTRQRDITLNSSELLPKMAAGTHFTQGPNLPSPSVPPLPPSLPMAANPMVQISQPQHSLVTPKPVEEFPALMKTYAKLQSEKGSLIQHPHNVIQSFESSLERFGMDRNVIIDSMSRLRKLTKSERFAEALLSGYIKPDDNQPWGFAELRKQREFLNNLGDTEFDHLVWDDTGTPNVCTTNTYNAQPSPGYGN